MIQYNVVTVSPWREEVTFYSGPLHSSPQSTTDPPGARHREGLIPHLERSEELWREQEWLTQ